MLVKLDGQPQREGIDITGICLEFNQYILAEDDLFTDNIDFGEIYFGKSVL